MLFSYWRKKKSPLDSKEMKPVNPKGNQPWIFTGRTDAEAEAPILWPLGHLMRRTNSSEKTLMLEEIEGRWEGGHRGWAGWMAASIQWTWVWASSGRWWRTGKTGMLQSMGTQRVRHDWVTEQQQRPSQGEENWSACGFSLWTVGLFAWLFLVLL